MVPQVHERRSLTKSRRLPAALRDGGPTLEQETPSSRLKMLDVMVAKPMEEDSPGFQEENEPTAG
jgi:hypothetical protein